MKIRVFWIGIYFTIFSAVEGSNSFSFQNTAWKMWDTDIQELFGKVGEIFKAKILECQEQAENKTKSCIYSKIVNLNCAARDDCRLFQPVYCCVRYGLKYCSRGSEMDHEVKSSFNKQLKAIGCPFLDMLECHRPSQCIF